MGIITVTEKKICPHVDNGSVLIDKTRKLPYATKCEAPVYFPQKTNTKCKMQQNSEVLIAGSGKLRGPHYTQAFPAQPFSLQIFVSQKKV